MVSSLLTAPLFGDEATRACFDDKALIREMVDVEVALACVQAELGIVPVAAAEEISALAANFEGDPKLLSDAVAHAGVPVPALVQNLSENLSSEAADWVHYGATSQDILDCAICKCAARALGAQEEALKQLINALTALSSAHERTLMLARTRGQFATPITFGLRVAKWAQPLMALEQELPDIRDAAFVVQFGGASGGRSALKDKGPAVASGLAAALGLRDAPSWHTDRNGLRRLGGWLLRLTQALAKIGRDIALSARGEISELKPGAGGGSSTMPHKFNPVQAEALGTLSVMALAYDTGLSASAVHAEERDGAMWAAEWALLPAMFECAAASLSHTAALIQDLTVNTEIMAGRANGTEAALSEAAVFALAGKIGRVRAVREVKKVLTQGSSLHALLEKHLGQDAKDALTPETLIAPAAEVAREIFDKRKL